jgi:hypothetical protein
MPRGEQHRGSVGRSVRLRRLAPSGNYEARPNHHRPPRAIPIYSFDEAQRNIFGTCVAIAFVMIVPRQTSCFCFHVSSALLFLTYSRVPPARLTAMCSAGGAHANREMGSKLQATNSSPTTTHRHLTATIAQQVNSINCPYCLENCNRHPAATLYQSN